MLDLNEHLAFFNFVGISKRDGSENQLYLLSFCSGRRA